jgi:hypothetical protein
VYHVISKFIPILLHRKLFILYFRLRHPCSTAFQKRFICRYSMAEAWVTQCVVILLEVTLEKWNRGKVAYSLGTEMEASVHRIAHSSRSPAGRPGFQSRFNYEDISVATLLLGVLPFSKNDSLSRRPWWTIQTTSAQTWVLALLWYNLRNIQSAKYKWI